MASRSCKSTVVRKLSQLCLLKDNYTFVKAVVISELPWPHKLNESGMNIFVLHDKKQRYSTMLQNKRLYKRQLIKTHPTTNKC